MDSTSQLPKDVLDRISAVLSDHLASRTGADGMSPVYNLATTFAFVQLPKLREAAHLQFLVSLGIELGVELERERILALLPPDTALRRPIVEGEGLEAAMARRNAVQLAKEFPDHSSIVSMRKRRFGRWR